MMDTDLTYSSVTATSRRRSASISTRLCAPSRRLPSGGSRDRQIDPGYLAQLRRCDWLLLDASTAVSEVLPAFAHGQFIPILRARQATNTGGAVPTPSSTEDVLFGAFEVGYRKDVISWHTQDDLLTGLKKRIDVLRLEPELIGDSSQADEYFTSAAKRKERVFLSYAGSDSDQGAQFAAELGKHFQDVFDYRTAAAIRPGEPWLDQFFEHLSAAAVGILLISAAYQQSRKRPRSEPIRRPGCTGGVVVRAAGGVVVRAAGTGRLGLLDLPIGAGYLALHGTWREHQLAGPGSQGRG
jgi:TIR domain